MAKLTLHVKKDHFFLGSIRVLGAHDVLATIVETHSVDGQTVVVIVVLFHVLDALLQLAVIAEPRDDRRRRGNDATVEVGGLALHARGAVRLDDEARLGFASVEERVVHVVFEWTVFAQRRIIGDASSGGIGSGQASCKRTHSGHSSSDMVWEECKNHCPRGESNCRPLDPQSNVLAVSHISPLTAYIYLALTIPPPPPRAHLCSCSLVRLKIILRSL